MSPASPHSLDENPTYCKGKEIQLASTAVDNGATIHQSGSPDDRCIVMV